MSRPKGESAISESRSISRNRRRTKAQVSSLRDSLRSLLEADCPTTVRSVFYRAVSAGLISKTEKSYRQDVIRLLGLMRRDGSIPYGWITDGTRLRRKPLSYTGLRDLLDSQATMYRRDLWASKGVSLEIWSEKEAIAGVLYAETSDYDVPLMTCRGYPSLSFLHGAAEELKESGRPTFIYYFGDRDPSGLDIPRVVERELRKMAPAAEIHFERVAVTEQQIVDHQLLTRPPKPTDARRKGFKGPCVEVDALPSSVLRALVRERIERHIDPREVAMSERIEELERNTLRSLKVPSKLGAQIESEKAKDAAWTAFLGAVPDDDAERERRWWAAVANVTETSDFSDEDYFGPEEWQQVERAAGAGGGGT